jgi:hypothetical protein
MIGPLDGPVRRPDAEGQSENTADVHQDDIEVGSAFAEMQERCKSVSLQIGGPWAWTRTDRKWTLKWEDHDGSTGSIEHDDIHILVREALRRVRLCQEKSIGVETERVAARVAAMQS